MLEINQQRIPDEFQRTSIRVSADLMMTASNENNKYGKQSSATFADANPFRHLNTVITNLNFVCWWTKSQWSSCNTGVILMWSNFQAPITWKAALGRTTYYCNSWVHIISLHTLRLLSSNASVVGICLIFPVVNALLTAYNSLQNNNKNYCIISASKCWGRK